MRLKKSTIIKKEKMNPFFRRMIEKEYGEDWKYLRSEIWVDKKGIATEKLYIRK